MASLVVMALSMALLMRIWIVSSCGAESLVGVLSIVLMLSKSWILSIKLSESDSSSVSNFLNCRSNLAICSSTDEGCSAGGGMAMVSVEYSRANLVVRFLGGGGMELELDLLMVEESSG